MILEIFVIELKQFPKLGAFDNNSYDMFPGKIIAVLGGKEKARKQKRRKRSRGIFRKLGSVIYVSRDC